jgi:hypothetical protein
MMSPRTVPLPGGVYQPGMIWIYKTHSCMCGVNFAYSDKIQLENKTEAAGWWGYLRADDLRSVSTVGEKKCNNTGGGG